MAKSDNPFFTLMVYCRVKLKCDNETLECRYVKTTENPIGVWFVNGENTGLQVTALCNMLKEKYKKITVLYKR